MIHWILHAMLGAAVAAYLTKLIIRTPGQTWVHKVFTMIDDLVCLFFGGQFGISISSTTAMANLDGKPWGVTGCQLLNRAEFLHCQKAMQADYARAIAAASRLRKYLDKINAE